MMAILDEFPKFQEINFKFRELLEASEASTLLSLESREVLLSNVASEACSKLSEITSLKC